MGAARMPKVPVTDFAPHDKEFRYQLDILLKEIFDQDVPFTQTEDEKTVCLLRLQKNVQTVAHHLLYPVACIIFLKFIHIWATFTIFVPDAFASDHIPCQEFPPRFARD